MTVRAAGTEKRAGAAPRPRRWLKRALVAAGIAVPVGILGLWIAVNRVEWLGPYVADGLRAVVGIEAVAQLEDFAYGVQDRINTVWRRGEKPKAYWEVPKALPTPPPEPVAEAAEADPPVPRLPPFRPKDVGPALKSWSAPGDGLWVPIVDPRHPTAEPHMYKTLLHPDKSRSWAEVFVVAVDLRRTALHLVPGTREPRANTLEAMEVERPGIIPAAERESVLAAFNGGFKTEHGGYGMKVGDLTYVTPQKGVCAVALFKDQSMRVDNWDEMVADEAKMQWWRQGPNCMIEDGKLHPRLTNEALAKKWGATLDGETVIRRSALGIDASGEVLYVSITNNTTAKAIAEGVAHAGAVTVLQLDVNYSYPKFVTFEPKKELEEGEEPKRIAVPLADGFEFSEDEYLRKASRRDFFYLAPRPPDERTARNGGAE